MNAHKIVPWLFVLCCLWVRPGLSAQEGLEGRCQGWLHSANLEAMCPCQASSCYAFLCNRTGDVAMSGQLSPGKGNGDFSLREKGCESSWSVFTGAWRENQSICAND